MIIYKATFNNGKVYIGKTKNDIEYRIGGHKYAAKKNHEKDKNVIFYSAIRKYGFDSITWEVIDNCLDEEDMKEKEIFYIKEYKSLIKDNGYNMVLGDYDSYINGSHNGTDLIKYKLESNGHDSSKYVIMTDELENQIIEDYKNGGMVRRISKKFGITRNRIKRLLKKHNIPIEYRNDNEFIPSDELINDIITRYKSNELIKNIAKSNNLSEMLVSRVLHDEGIRESKRFKDGTRYDGWGKNGRKNIKRVRVYDKEKDNTSVYKNNKQ